MYKHYETSDDVFVDRKEHIEWMNDALARCKERSVVLHLKGIGGIGKSSLLNHWMNTHEKTIRLDCEQYSEFYHRLNMLTKGVVLQGVKLQRFDILWQIRQRFVEGVEPVREEGREWAKEVVMAIPFIGSLASIGSAISAVGSKVTPKLKGKYSTIGKWLQETLGKNHIEELLQILWKDPRRAEFLYLEAFLEDINSRADSNTPLLFLLDHFEYVDDTKAQWKYQRQKINETQLWTIFLSNLRNCVGVLASRRPVTDSKLIHVEESELTELDRDSCIEMLELQGVVDNNLQEKIVSVSGGNPFVLDIICDLINASEVSESDIEDLRADTLAEVRLKVWRRLFSEAEGLQSLINRAGLVPYFSERIIHIIAPELTPDSWDRLRRLSFVAMRSDGTFVLHDLAENLVRAGLGRQLSPLVSEVSSLLERESEEEHDLSLFGMALSVEAVFSEDAAMQKAKNIIHKLLRRESGKDALEILRNLSLRTESGRAEHQGMLGWALRVETRYAEAEATLKDAIHTFENLTKEDFAKHRGSVAFYLAILASVMKETARYAEAEVSYTKGLAIIRRLSAENPDRCSEDDAEVLSSFALLLGTFADRPEAGLALAQEAVEIYEQSNERRELPYALNILGIMHQRNSNRDKALLTFRKAIAQQREVISQDPTNTRYKSVFTAICGNLSNELYVRGAINEALDLNRESLDIRRELYAANPDIYGGRYAAALHWYGWRLWQVRQVSKAEPFYREASRIYEELEKKEPGGWTYSSSQNMFDLAYILVALERIVEAESVISKAIQFSEDYKKQARRMPYSMRPLAYELAGPVLQLYSRTFRVEMTESLISNVTEIFEQYERSSHFYEIGEGIVLNNIGASKLYLNQLSGTRNILEKASSLIEKHKEFQLVISMNTFAVSLCNLAILSKREGQLKKANELYLQALSIFDEIAHLIPRVFQQNLAVTLSNYSVLLRKMDLFDEAEVRLSQAIQIEREYAEIEPFLYEPILAIFLNNQGILLSVLNSHPKAEESLNEAIQLRRRLAARTPEMHQAGLAASLYNLGVLLMKTGKSSDAKALFREAAENWDQLIAKAPDLFSPRLAKTLHQLRLTILEDDGTQSEAKAIQKRLWDMNLDFPDDAELWIEEEEPLFSW